MSATITREALQPRSRQVASTLYEPRPAGRHPRIAVVVNANARWVEEGLIRDLRQLLVDETLFVSSDPSQSIGIAREIVEGHYDVVLCGGGDGTLSRCVTDVMGLRPSRPPAFGVLRLGTGNAVAQTLGAGKSGLRGIREDLRHARSPAARVPLALLHVEGQYAPFAGTGLDSLILEDYVRLSDGLKKTPLRHLAEGHAGYGLAIATRSVWRMMLESQPQVVIYNEGAPAQRISSTGAPLGPAIPAGGLIYRGPVTLAACSTVPFYGFGVRVFPQADLRSDRFQLRIADLRLYQMLPRIPQFLLSGSFSHERLWDYSCTAISMHLVKPAPFQIGGDLVGYRNRLEIGMTTLKGICGSRATLPAKVAAPDRIPQRAAA